MVHIPTPTEILEALADWHVDVIPFEPDGVPWHEHTTAGGWAPRGVTHHHTGDTPGSTKLLTDPARQIAMLRLLRYGRAGLPGPLCHGAPAMIPVPGPRRAALHLVGWGNVNHAGTGSVHTANALLSDAGLPGDLWIPGRDQSIDGNPLTWALEYMHPGDDVTDWPDELLECGHRSGMALAEASRIPNPAAHQQEHLEWTDRKVDRSCARAGVRVRILCAALTKNPTTTPDPEEPLMPTDEDVARFANAAAAATKAALLGADIRNPDPAYDGPGMPITVGQAIGGAYRGMRNIGGLITDVREAVVAQVAGHALTPEELRAVFDAALDAHGLTPTGGTAA